MSITLKAHYTQFKDSSGIRSGTMENVAAGTNLGDLSPNNKTERLSRRWDTLNTCSTVCAISCKDPADILAASSSLFSLTVLCSRASLSCVWSCAVTWHRAAAAQITTFTSVPLNGGEKGWGGEGAVLGFFFLRANAEAQAPRAGRGSERADYS